MAFQYVVEQNKRRKEEERVGRVLKLDSAHWRCGPAPKTILASFMCSVKLSQHSIIDTYLT